MPSDDSNPFAFAATDARFSDNRGGAIAGAQMRGRVVAEGAAIATA